MDSKYRTFLINKVSARVDPRIQDLDKLIRDTLIFTNELQPLVGALSPSEKKSITRAVVLGHVKLPFPFSWFQSFIVGLLINNANAQQEEDQWQK